jgi:hypothetical protein
MSNYNVMSPIPQPVMGKAKSDANFEKHLNALPTSDTKVMPLKSKMIMLLLEYALTLKTITTKMKLVTV